MTKNNFIPFNSISKYLMRPVDASSLGAFRFFFGILLLWSTLKYFYKGWIKKKFIDPDFFFTYPFFDWVTPWPGDGMYYHFAVMGAAALFLGLGLFYRLSALVFFITYTYFFLIDKTEYNNHFYFISLLGFLFCFINADRWMSLDALWRKKLRTGVVPYWNVLIVKAQVFIVYFYGGIAKINPDWLSGEPLRHWLKEPAQRDSTPALVAKFLESEFGVYFFSYGGLMFDLAMGFLLIWRKTRLLAFGLILIFNLTNDWLFNIGIFPFLMIAATIIFVEPETPRRWLKKLFSRIQEPQFQDVALSPLFKKAVVGFVGVYLAIQVLVPFRHWLYEGNVSWTEEGHHFSWRMKLRSKEGCGLFFMVSNPATGETWPIYPKQLLKSRQFMMACTKPDMTLQFAHHLGERLKKGQGIKDPFISARSAASLNYRPLQRLIDPEVNMMEMKYSVFRHSDWILPLKE